MRWTVSDVSTHAFIAFENVSGNLRREADHFLSGYLVPGLVSSAGKPWGQPGSRVRGVCYYYPGNGKEVGFFRFLERPDGNLWLRDERDEHSPYASAAFHVNNMPAGFDASVLPSREIVFEFELESAAVLLGHPDCPRQRDRARPSSALPAVQCRSTFDALLRNPRP